MNYEIFGTYFFAESGPLVQAVLAVLLPVTLPGQRDAATARAAEVPRVAGGQRLCTAVRCNY